MALGSGVSLRCGSECARASRFLERRTMHCGAMGREKNGVELAIMGSTCLGELQGGRGWSCGRGC